MLPFMVWVHWAVGGVMCYGDTHRHARWPTTGTDPITDVSTAEEVRQWLEAAGFGSSTSALGGMDGSQLLALSKEELEKLTPDGARIHAALHGLRRGAFGVDACTLGVCGGHPATAAPASATTGTGSLGATSTAGEVTRWLKALGFHDGVRALAGMDGQQLLALSKEQLQKLTPDGEAIHAALHGVAVGVAVRCAECAVSGCVLQCARCGSYHRPRSHHRCLNGC